MAKVKFCLSLDEEIAERLRTYAKEHHKTVAAAVTDWVLSVTEKEKEEQNMIVKTAVKQYRDKEIFLQSGIDLAYLDKNEDVEEKFGYTVAHATVKNVNTEQSPDAVTIYF